LTEVCERVMVLRSDPRRRALSSLTGVVSGVPAQVGWMTTRRMWRAAQDEARHHDVVVANTVRSVRGSLPAPMVVDYVDALSWNMATRATGPEPAVVRLFARFEAWRMRSWERRVASWASAAVATTAQAAAVLPGWPPPVVIPVPWDGELPELRHDERDIDVIFTGDMRYPPNREGAALLARVILPLMRAQRPDVQLWIVGRSASRLRLPDVVTRSDVPSIAPYLSRAKVAVSPVRGQGSLYKVLEAAANGAAIVASAWAIESYDGMEAEIAEDASSFADAVVLLLSDERRRMKRAEAAHSAVRAQHVQVLTKKLEAILAQVDPGLRSQEEQLPQPARRTGSGLP
jgi:hypothetical protein